VHSWQVWRRSRPICSARWPPVSCGWKRLRKFGDNEDGVAAAERFVQAGQDYIDTMRNAQRVFATMAATYRAAGRTVAESDAANEQMFQGQS
jgi:hypothetical protein